MYTSVRKPCWEAGIATAVPYPGDNNNTPPLPTLQADFIDIGESANAERCMRREFSPKKRQQFSLRVSVPPLFIGEKVGSEKMFISISSKQYKHQQASMIDN